MTTAENNVRCPRCKETCLFNGDEPFCASCGYHDFSQTVERRPQRPPGYGGNELLVRYDGPSEVFEDTVLYVALEPPQGRESKLNLKVMCPFSIGLKQCGKRMTNQSLAGKRKYRNEQRYRCSRGHRISLFLNTEGGKDFWR